MIFKKFKADQPVKPVCGLTHCYVDTRTGVLGGSMDESFVDKDLKSKFVGYLKNIDTYSSMLIEKIHEKTTDERLEKCYDRYNIPVLSVPLSELVQADMQILLMCSRMEGISKKL